MRRFELHRALIVRELVSSEDELVTLDVKAQREIFGQVRRETFHVATLHQLIDWLLLRNDETRAASLKCTEDVRKNVQDLLT